MTHVLSNEVLALDINYEKGEQYTIQYQLMDQDGTFIDSYHQSRPLTQEEIESLIFSLEKEFNDQQVPECVREQFYNHVKIY